MDALLHSAPPAQSSPSLQLQLLWKRAASTLWGFILIIATVMEIVLPNMCFNNILHSLSIFALKISEVLNRRQWESSPVFPQGKLKQAGKDLWCRLIFCDFGEAAHSDFFRVFFAVLSPPL